MSNGNKKSEDQPAQQQTAPPSPRAPVHVAPALPPEAIAERLRLARGQLPWEEKHQQVTSLQQQLDQQQARPLSPRESSLQDFAVAEQQRRTEQSKAVAALPKKPKQWTMIGHSKQDDGKLRLHVTTFLAGSPLCEHCHQPKPIKAEVTANLGANRLMELLAMRWSALWAAVAR
jgi:hypothetical protein